ncbi:conjugal transfer protein TraN, partial [Zunongwangia sp. F297]|nr:conjugal transfer protein TraN [Zunongwangia sp. F297]
MKTFILILIGFVYTFAPRLCLAQATAQQQPIPLDTIYANDTKNVALFFPEPIRQGITGSDNFVFTYNREEEQYFGLLQAKPGKESNLLVVNRNGSIFSYIVRYKKQLSKLNYFIPLSKSIGNERPILKDSILVKSSEEFVDNSTYYY